MTTAQENITTAEKLLDEVRSTLSVHASAEVKIRLATGYASLAAIKNAAEAVELSREALRQVDEAY